MRIISIAVIVLLWVGLVIGLYWYYLYEPPARRPDIAAPAPESPDSGNGETGERYPVPESDREHIGTDSVRADTDAVEKAPESDAPGPAPLPALGESDTYVRALLAPLFGRSVLDEWLKDERIVERIVVTVNSLDGDSIALRFWPVKHLEGLPSITREGDVQRWSAVNALRYKPVVELLTGVEPERLARVYFRNYALFQRAYDRLGVEPHYFNDRLVNVIDHLLDAPTVEPGFRVTQPKVLYEFADPELESESWGRKVLMRMGPGNADRVKDWLRRLREELVSGQAETR
jgi:hypothetical protein